MQPRDRTPKVRENGFEKPFAEEQLMTWALFPSVMIHFIAFLQPLLWKDIASQVAIPVVFYVAAVLTSFGVYSTCSINPCDANILPRDHPRRKEKESEGAMTSADSIYCYVCEKGVHKSSKHCKFCQKCVTSFDHHC